MTILTLNEATFTGRAPLFQNLSLTIGPGDRYGVVAQNGAGKTTLLRCLAGSLEFTSGDVVRRRGTVIGIVPQDVEPELRDLTFRDAVLAALPDEVRESESWRAEVVLASFDVPPQMLDMPVSALSGGWQRLMLLVRAWVIDPDLLLMDEPTNHLDLEKILILENWLNTWVGDVPVVIASHDRCFLDAVTNRTLFLRPEASCRFSLPYSRARAELAQADAARAAELERDLKQAQQLRRQSAKLKNIGINSGSDLLQKKQKQLRVRAEKIEDAVTALHSDRRAEIRLANRDTHAKSLIRIENLRVTAPDGQELFKVPKMSVFKGDRIIVLGRNGTGKTTFLNRLHEALVGQADVPGISTTPTLVMGHMDQALSALPLHQSPFEFVTGRGRSDAQCRSALAMAGIAYDMQSRPIGNMSFGERSRLALLGLRFDEPNFYLLDEPTNHVDIAGQEALAGEISDLGACCVIVSHDRAFARDVGNRFFVVERGELHEHGSPEAFFSSVLP